MGVSTQSVLAGLALRTAIYAVLLLIPLSLGVAILRYRLWDVDLLINKVLVYGALTATLGVFYIGSVVGLIALLRGFTGERSTVAIAVSTLIMAALFQPLRRRVGPWYQRRYLTVLSRDSVPEPGQGGARRDNHGG